MDNLDNRPLAEKMRPEKLAEVVGQDQAVGSDSIIGQMLENDKLFSIMLWGPPGTGKTTIARIIANESEAQFIEVSAVSMGKPQVMEAIKQAQISQRLGERTVLFVDEIHRFNKAQQDMFLPFVESGVITLIGATTENPSFEVISPLMSRMQLVLIKPLSEDDLVEVVQRAAKLEGKTISPKSAHMIASFAQGDARAAIGVVEVSASLSKTKSIKTTIVQQAISSGSRINYDKKGDGHYDTISAFIKSMRASDAEAALYYAFRMLGAGEDPKFIARRITIFASEDIGMASPHALTLAISCFQAVERIGMPESEYIFAHTITAMCEAKKSRRTTDMMNSAKSLAAKHPSAQIPMHLRNAPTKMMREIGYGQGRDEAIAESGEKGTSPNLPHFQ